MVRLKISQLELYMELHKHNIYDISYLKKFVKHHLVGSGLIDRYKHTIAVSLLMREKAQEIGLCSDTAQCVGLLHDIGYSDDIKKTGFHALDGYNYLKNIDQCMAERIALHTSTPEEAELRGINLPKVKQDKYARLLSYADSRVMGNGKVVSFEERLNDIINRYGETHLVSIANKKAWVRLAKENASITSENNRKPKLL